MRRFSKNPQAGFSWFRSFTFSLSQHSISGLGRIKCGIFSIGFSTSRAGRHALVGQCWAVRWFCLAFLSVIEFHNRGRNCFCHIWTRGGRKDNFVRSFAFGIPEQLEKGGNGHDTQASRGRKRWGGLSFS